MKNLIVYSTKYGSGKEIAEILKKKIEGKTDAVDIKTHDNNELDSYDNIILGASIYAGRPLKEMNKYIKRNTDALLKKRLFLYISAGSLGNNKKDTEQLKSAYSEKLFNHSLHKDNLGYNLNFDKMNAIEKFLIKKIKGVDTNKKNISDENINKMADKINKL